LETGTKMRSCALLVESSVLLICSAPCSILSQKEVVRQKFHGAADVLKALLVEGHVPRFDFMVLISHMASEPRKIQNAKLRNCRSLPTAM
jgi:hypothetical protein